eukprot:3400336-Pyramimonas_sp.AAC.1
MLAFAGGRYDHDAVAVVEDFASYQRTATHHTRKGGSDQDMRNLGRRSSPPRKSPLVGLELQGALLASNTNEHRGGWAEGRLTHGAHRPRDFVRKCSQRVRAHQG